MEYLGEAPSLAVAAPQGLATATADPARLRVTARAGEPEEGVIRQPERRWTWRDPFTGDSWQMPINPHQMTTPHKPHGVSLFVRNPPAMDVFTPAENAGGMARLFAQKLVPLEWSITGVIRTAQFYHEFINWRARAHRVYLHDDLGRRFDVLIQDVDFTEDKPAPGNRVYTTRYEYTCKMLLYGVRG